MPLMKTEEIERCPSCGAYCVPAKHSPDACAQIQQLNPNQHGGCGSDKVEAKDNTKAMWAENDSISIVSIHGT
jgi:hypothetical protein